MEYCPRCGVEVEEDVSRCPLCNAVIPEYDEKGDIVGVKSGSQVFPPDNLDSTVRERGLINIKRLVWVVFSILLLASALIVTAVDLISSDGGGISWSVYPLISLCGIWVIITCIIMFSRYPLLMILGLFGSIEATVFLLMLSAGAEAAFLKLPFPIIIVIFAAIGIYMLVLSFLQEKGLNAVGFFCFAIAAICMGIDLIIKKDLEGVIRLGWSIIVAAALIPIGGMLIYFHYRLRGKVDFKKIFHI